MSPWKAPEPHEHPWHEPRRHHGPPPPSFGMGHRPLPHEVTNEGIAHLSLQIDEVLQRLEGLERQLAARHAPETAG